MFEIVIPAWKCKYAHVPVPEELFRHKFVLLFLISAIHYFIITFVITFRIRSGTLIRISIWILCFWRLKFNPTFLHFFQIQTIDIVIIIVKSSDLKEVPVFDSDQSWIKLSNWYFRKLRPRSAAKVVHEAVSFADWNGTQAHWVHHIGDATSYVQGLFDKNWRMRITRLRHGGSSDDSLFCQIYLETLIGNLLFVDVEPTRHVDIVSIRVARGESWPHDVAEVMLLDLLLVCLRDM